MSGHAFLPPSGADAWVHCSLWPTMNARFAKGPTDETEEGEAAHWVNLCTMRDKAYPALGSRTPNGYAVTPEMIKGAELWWVATGGTPGHDEERVVNNMIHADHNWGTPDRWEYASNTLTVFDYKFGHKLIEVFENFQLINYAGLLMRQLAIDDLTTRFRFVIVQPRGFHRDGPVREWSGMLHELRAYWNLLRSAAQRATEPDKIQGSVGDQCKYCPGRHACDAAQRNVYVSLDLAGHSVPLELEPAALGVELEVIERGLKLMQARYEGLKEQARSVMLSGQRVPRWQLSESEGKEQWTIPADQAAGIGAVFGVDIKKPMEVLTPRQAREKGLPAEIVKGLSHKPRGELQVLRDDDSLTRKLFG